MNQEHERGLGNWQAELAEWPNLFLSAHGALHALDEAFAGLQVDRERMLRNIASLHGLVFAEAASSYLAGAIGRPKAQALLEDLSRRAGADHGLEDLLRAAVRADPALSAQVDLAGLAQVFDPVAAAEPARRLAERQLQALRADMAAFEAAHPFHQ